MKRVCYVVVVMALCVLFVSGTSIADFAIEQEDCVKVSQPTKDSTTDMYVVPVNNTCTYKVKVVVTNGGVNYGKFLDPSASGQIILGKAGAKEDYAVTWKKAA